MTVDPASNAALLGPRPIHQSVEVARSLIQQLLLKVGRPEESSRAGRSSQITVQPDVFRRNVQTRLQPLHQADKLGHLAVRKRPAIAIANHAYRNGMLVVMSRVSAAALNMSSGQLLVPAVSHMNDPVPQAIAVPDQKVIPQALIPKGLMPAVT